MQETRRLFSERFQARISEIHDQLSSRGLQDPKLEATYKCVGLFAGNVDAYIVQVADSIRKLAELAPPSNLYSDVKDEGLAAQALSEADEVDARVEAAMKELPNAEIPNAVREFFSYDFEACCLNQIEYLRAEILHRLGPAAYDGQEIASFMRLTEMKNESRSSIALASDYAPCFRRLAVKMKRKAVALAQPISIEFSENQLGAGLLQLAKPQEMSHRLLITLKVPKPVASGYVVLLFTSRPGVITSDFPGGKFVMPRDIIDNPQLSRVLKNDANSVWALQIGKTVILPTTPIHVLVGGLIETHVAQALLFDY